MVPNSWDTIYIFVSWGGVRLSPLGTSATNWLIVPAPDDRWWVWSSHWNENWQGRPKFSEKTCPSAILSIPSPIDLTWARTRAHAVGSRWLTAWATARPLRVHIVPKSRLVQLYFPVRFNGMLLNLLSMRQFCHFLFLLSSHLIFIM
jgi:hypothetical protein